MSDNELKYTREDVWRAIAASLDMDVATAKTLSFHHALNLAGVQEFMYARCPTVRLDNGLRVNGGEVIRATLVHIDKGGYVP